MSSSTKPRVGVVGCGAFGALVALRLNRAGYPTIVFERHHKILNGASYNNQNRLHLGFHYPRDIETARQCIRGFERFRSEFADCILENFPNAYFIAEAGSLVSPDEYLAFCSACGLSYDLIDHTDFDIDVRGVALGLLTDEVIYDCKVLSSLIQTRLARAGIEILTDHEVTRIERKATAFHLKCADGKIFELDAIVNCSYADINRLTAMLGFDIAPRQYEYTVTPIIRWRDRPLGMTIIDGPFCTVLPHGKTGNFLLYHVDHAVISRYTRPLLDPSWLASDGRPSHRVDLEAVFERARAAATEFIPSLADATLVGFLQGPRMVLPNADDTDRRPSMVRHYGDNYITVFSGKINHCVWVGDEVVSLLS